jgi:mono/diheme cytochrome c family protein
MEKKRGLSFALLAASVLATGGLLAGGHQGDVGRGLPPVVHAQWQAECAACHEPYHPGLLPARSWLAVMAGLPQHFGQDASLDSATRQSIEGFLVTHAADRNASRRSERITASIPAGSAPLRISEAPYIVAKHAKIRADVFARPAIGSRANCAACHTTAARSYFDESGVRIPKNEASIARPANTGSAQ